MFRLAILALVLVTPAASALQDKPAQAAKPSAEKKMSASAKPAQASAKPAQASAPLSAPDRAALAQAAKRLSAAAAKSPAAPGEVAVKASAAAQGTSKVVLDLASRKDARLTAEQTAVVFKAAADAAAVHRGLADRKISPTDLLRLQADERKVVLTYWNSPTSEGRKLEALAPYQVGYIFDQHFQTLKTDLTSKGTPAEIPGVSWADLKAAFNSGSTEAQALSQQVNLPRSPELESLLNSLGVASQRALHGQLTSAVSRSLVVASNDLGQQRQLFSAHGEAFVHVTVKTTRRDADKKVEVEGFNVRYELEADDLLDTPKGASLAGTTSLKADLGPFHYYLWAVESGKTVSEKKLVNLGDPPLPSQEIELPLIPQETKP